MARILVVDDDSLIREAVRRMLEPVGYEVEEAANGKEAARACRHRRADLVLCDLFMPEKCGIELIRELPREFPGMKVVAMSGGGFGGRMNMLPDALAFGAAAALHKPFDQADLLRAVRGALESTPTP